MSRRKFDGVLPDGTPTKSTATYLKAWRALTDPVCEAFGVELVGFDPGMLLIDKDTRKSFDIPGWAARRLVKRLAEGKSGD